MSYTAAQRLVLETAYNLSKAQIEADLCKHSFRRFIKSFWDQVPGTQPLIWNWHLDVFCDELEAVAKDVFANRPRQNDVVLNVSPGTSKSTIWSILFPAWLWTVMPHCRIMTASHTDTLALDLANKTRELIKGDKFRTLFPTIELRRDQDTKGYYANTSGGDRLTCTVAGKSPMGFHCHVAIIDDPLDPKKAMSEKEVEAAKHFVSEVIPTRRVDKRVSVTLLVMQRLGLGDPTDVMLAQGEKEGAVPVRHVCLPAELIKGSDGVFLDSEVKPRELAQRYVNGLMDPNRLDRVALDEQKARGAHFYSTQFLQKPYAKSGGRFQEEYFNKRIKAAPFDCKRVVYVDRAATSEDKDGCATAATLMAKSKDNSYYVEEVLVGHWEPYERNQKLRAFALRCRNRFGPKNEPTWWVEREGGASGRDAWLAIAKALDGFPIYEHNVSKLGNKELRSEPWSCQLAAGNVYIVDNGESQGTGRATWDIASWVAEHLAFPLGRWKDQVDSASGCYTQLMGGRSIAGKTMRTLTFGKTRGPKPRVVVVDDESLANLIIEQPTLLISIQDPPPLGDDLAPSSGLSKIIDKLVLRFADVDPADHQESWVEPITPYGVPCELVMMTPAHGKSLWAAILKHRPTPWEVLVLQDDGKGRAQSAALAICEAMSWDIKTQIWNPMLTADNKDITSKPANGHVYRTVKAARHSVI